ncbi:DUF4367 domain-containing protein [Moorellaceae bacterium AZ2]
MAQEGYWERLLKEIIIREIERQPVPTPTDNQWAEVWRTVQSRRREVQKSRRRRYLVAAAVLLVFFIGMPAILYPEVVTAWSRQILSFTSGRDRIMVSGQQEASSTLPGVTMKSPADVMPDQEGVTAGTRQEARDTLPPELKDKGLPFPVKLPTYLPPGFELKSLEVEPQEAQGAAGARVRLVYGNQSHTVEITQSNTAEDQVTFSSGRVVREETITINGLKARLVGGEGSYSVHFRDEDHVAIQVKGNVEKEDIVRIAASLRKAAGPVQE